MVLADKYLGFGRDSIATEEKEQFSMRFLKCTQVASAKHRTRTMRKKLLDMYASV